MVLSDQRGLIYDRAVQQEWLVKLTGDLPSTNEMYSQWVPTLFVLAVPFSLFPIDQAHLLWNLFSLSIGVVGVAMLLISFNRLSRVDIVLLLVGLVASFPAFQTLYIGQTSLLVLGCTSLYFWALLKERNNLAGAFLALLFKPQFLPFLVIPPLVQKRYKVFLSCLLVGVITIVVCGLIIGWQTVFQYPSVLLNVESGRFSMSENMITLRAITHQFLPKSLDLAFSLALTLASLLLVAIWWRKAGNNVELRKWAVALTIILTLIASPHCFENDAVLLGIAAALTLPVIRPSQFQSSWSTPLRLYTGLFLAYPVVSWFVFLGIPKAAQGIFFMAVHVVLLASGYAAFRQRIRQDSNSAPSVDV